MLITTAVCKQPEYAREQIRQKIYVCKYYFVNKFGKSCILLVCINFSTFRNSTQSLKRVRLHLQGSMFEYLFFPLFSGSCDCSLDCSFPTYCNSFQKRASIVEAGVVHNIMPYLQYLESVILCRRSLALVTASILKWKLSLKIATR